MTEPAIVLPFDTVCACLHETGHRYTTVWERCERCHAFMATDGVELVKGLRARDATIMHDEGSHNANCLWTRVDAALQEQA